jgi:hypothetical protein
VGRLAITTHIDIQGKDYSLLLDVNGVVAFEEEMHESFFTFTTRSQAPDYVPTFKEIRALLYGSMLHHQPSMTVTEVGALATPGDLIVILAAIKEVIKNASPEGGEADPNLSSRRTGSPSGRSGGKHSDLPTANSGG